MDRFTKEDLFEAYRQFSQSTPSNQPKNEQELQQMFNDWLEVYVERKKQSNKIT